MKFTIAVAQIDPVLGDLQKNVEKHLVAADRAAQQGAHLVVFPELSLTGYSLKDLTWDMALHVRDAPLTLAPLIEKSHTISILAGLVEEDDAFNLYNAAWFFDQGTVRSVHRKTYPPTYGMFEEMRYFNRGQGVGATDTRYGRIGVLICEDLWHPALPYLLALDGAQVLIGLVASPTRIAGSEEPLPIAIVNRENHQAYARLLSTYVVTCNRVGYEDGISFWGGSDIVSPDGEPVAQGKLLEEDLILGSIDGNEVRRARRFSRHFLDEDVDLVLHHLSRIRAKR